MPDTMPPKHVRFIQSQPPALKSGSYTVTLSQSLGTVGTVPDLVRRFAVSGERFALDPSEIAAVYPPSLANGEFDGVLPHVVLGKHVLPWERTISPPDTAAGPDSDFTWLAVLVFNAAETPTLQTGAQVKTLVPQGRQIRQLGKALDPNDVGTLPAGTVSYPVLAMAGTGGAVDLEWGETPQDPCSTIDVPAALFSQVAPTADDMGYLAHIRQADTEDSAVGDSGDLVSAVVLANRVAGENAEAYAFLVSLMGMQAYLPTEAGGSLPAGTQAVRLVVFFAWRYFANASDETFRALAEGLNQGGLSTLQVAPPAGCAPFVAHALAMGYVPLDHQLRQGGHTVSWYRGPLTPYRVDPFLELVAQTPDALVRFDTEHGLLDVSYAAAWQLGQLMALQAPSFANGLYGWRAAQVKAAAAASLAASQAATLANSSHLTALIGNAAPDPAAAALPAGLTAWLTALGLLSGVPLAYLVPDERMLPPESMRFFCLDRNWIRALTDGAFSIGRAALEDLQHDLAGTPLAVLGPEKALVDGDRVVTGFLLRSQLLAGWPRLNVVGYRTAGPDLTQQAVPKLRLERITAEVMICLFDGAVAQVMIAEPPEHWHSGLERDNPGTPWTTTLRYLADTAQAKAGEQIPAAGGTLKTVAVAMRPDGRTLRVAETAAQLRQAVGFSPFTSAEFAIELNQGASAVLFPVKA